MNGLMMEFPLTVSAIFRRAEQMFRRREIVWRNADKSLSRYTVADFAARARRLASALEALGVHAGDRTVLVDESLLPLWEQVRPKVNVKDVVVFGATRPVAPGYHAYEDLVS